MPNRKSIFDHPKEVHDTARELIQRDVYLNQTAMIEAALETGLFEQEEIVDSSEPVYLGKICGWWAVSEFLADQLLRVGETVLSNSYGVWWGRRCGGNEIILDGTIQVIVANIYESV